MKKNLKEMRTEKRLSQQELANLSGVSLRTIQRIEKGESSGSPYVIRALCTALDVEPKFVLFELDNVYEREPDNVDDRLGDESIINIENKYNTNKEIKYINFSALIVLIIPFANLISVPFFYFLFKKKLSYTNSKIMALKILSFQIMWSILTIMLMILTPLFKLCLPSIPESILEIPVFIWIYWLMLFLHLITTLVISFRINRVENAMQYIPNVL